jgi:hypothetical protein
MAKYLFCGFMIAALAVMSLDCTDSVNQSPTLKNIDVISCATPNGDLGFSYTGGTITAVRCSVGVILTYCTGIVMLQMVNARDSLLASCNLSSVPACTCKTCTGIVSKAVFDGLRPNTAYVLKFQRFWGSSSRECLVPCTTTVR